MKSNNYSKTLFYFLCAVSASFAIASQDPIDEPMRKHKESHQHYLGGWVCAPAVKQAVATASYCIALERALDSERGKGFLSNHVYTCLKANHYLYLVCFQTEFVYILSAAANRLIEGFLFGNNALPLDRRKPCLFLARFPCFVFASHMIYRALRWLS